MDDYKVVHAQRLGKEGSVNWQKLVIEKPNGEVFLCQMHRSFFDRLDHEQKPKTIKLTTADAFEVKPIEGSFFMQLWLSPKKQA